MGLLECKKLKLTGPIELVCDSQYVLGMASGRMSPNTNRTLVGKLRALSLELNVGTRWVRGHSKETWNEHCDKLAKRGKLEAQQALK
ncbi:Ribonuclease H domain containing protein [uncultured Caudovirales phage]|uniref:Ribonuclease H domain containing protein n=1 Tax=uncultured Caudovirales phage TaxID=2100421 RepID=A0A6J5KZ22_9CAUD|nr:Ribonuclease H domain containing protein [uncultured Caudovirales phage]